MSSATIVRDAIVSIYKGIDTRALRETELNIQPHFVPLNLSTLNLTLSKVIVQDPKELEIYKQDPELYAQVVEANLDFSDKVISLDKLKQEITTYVESKHRNRLDVAKGTSNFTFNNRTDVSIDKILTEKTYLPAIVYVGGQLVGVLYSNYDSAYNGLFRDYLNKKISDFIDESIYKGTNYKKGFDIGHILGNKGLATSPLALKFKKLLDAISSISDNIDIQVPGYIQANKTKLQELTSQVQSKIAELHQKSTYGATIEVQLEKEFGISAFLLSAKANVVIIQDRIENQKLYGKMVEGLLEREVGQLLANTNFSNSLVQELALRVAETIKGKKSFKQEKIPKGFPKEKVTQPAKPIKVGLANKSKVKIKPKTSQPIKSGLISNLTSLQALINQHLQSVISANMGDGSSRNVLNYRTGRFAASATVERMSQSRAGMITAFYTYMKNPYQTFEPGYCQGSPKSRDPKLLISKSIREIAADKVGNRLRAVLV